MAGPSTLTRSAYVAPIPPSTAQRRAPLVQESQADNAVSKVTEYLEKVVAPRGGECTAAEARALSLILQSSVKGKPDRMFLNDS